jgi:putative Holliday junction resolvase
VVYTLICDRTPHARTGRWRSPIGIAISDPLGITAQPLFTLHRASGKNGLRSDLKAIARFIRQHKIEIVLIGNPIHADGMPSPQSEKAQSFFTALREFLAPKHSNLIFHLIDERLTTREAHELLNNSSEVFNKSSRLARSDFIDQVAAVLMLESFLSAGKPSLLTDPESV